MSHQWPPSAQVRLGRCRGRRWDCQTSPGQWGCRPVITGDLGNMGQGRSLRLFSLNIVAVETAQTLTGLVSEQSLLALFFCTRVPLHPSLRPSPVQWCGLPEGVCACGSRGSS